MTRLQVYDPFTGSGIDELFRGFFAPVRREAESPAGVRIDVTENDQGYVVHAEIPGVKKEDIHVTIEGNQVSIAAEVKRETERKEGERVLRTERYAGSVFRSFALPVRARRVGERGEVRRRRARAQAREEAGRSPAASSRSSKDPDAARAREEGPAGSFRRVRARTVRYRDALRDELLVDVVAEVAPGRARGAREAPPDLGRDARVLEGARRELDDELARPLVVAGRLEVAAVHRPHLHRAALPVPDTIASRGGLRRGEPVESGLRRDRHVVAPPRPAGAGAAAHAARRSRRVWSPPRSGSIAVPDRRRAPRGYTRRRCERSCGAC